jgi:hypothetical protein
MILRILFYFTGLLFRFYRESLSPKAQLHTKPAETPSSETQKMDSATHNRDVLLS